MDATIFRTTALRGCHCSATVARGVLAITLALFTAPSVVRSEPCEAPVGSGAWAELPPPIRGYHTAIHDPVRNRMIVFGGYDRALRNETWVLSLSGAPAWSELATSGPRPSRRWGHTAIFDRAHDRMIVFGGWDESTVLDDTWALDLSGTPTWSRLVVSGTAPARTGHTAVYVPERGSMLVFGGGDGVSLRNETWELTLSDTPTWSQLPTTGTPPSPRGGQSAIYDPASKRMIVHGGADGSSIKTDTWSLDLSGPPAWAQVPVYGGPPPVRTGYSAIVDSARGRMILFGGNLYGLVYNDTWTLSLTGAPAWSQLETPHPAPGRADHSAIYDPTADRMIVYGGSDAAVYRGETWQLALSAVADWSPLEVPQASPQARQMATAIHDPVRNRMIVFGGVDRSYFGDTWTLTLAGIPAWAPLTPVGTPPSPRYGHVATYDSKRDRMLVFGGYDNASTRRNDTWSLAMSGTPAWSLLSPAGTPPSPRLLSAAIYDPVRDRLLVFGGTDGGNAGYSDLWQLDLTEPETWSQLAPFGPGPSPGIGFHAIYDPVRDRMVLFGGTETWALPLAGSLAWQPIAAPGSPPTPAAVGHSVVYDPVRDRMVVFGGADTPVDDTAVEHARTYALTLSDPPTWSELEPCWPPPGRYIHCAIYDPVRDRMVIFGGSDPVRHDTWALDFDGVPTTAAPPQAPSDFHLAAIIPNPANGRVRMALALAHGATVSLEIFDTQGRRMASLVSGNLAAGRHEFVWPAGSAKAPAAPGIYLARFAFPGGQQLRHIVILH